MCAAERRQRYSFWIFECINLIRICFHLPSCRFGNSNIITNEKKNRFTEQWNKWMKPDEIKPNASKNWKFNSFYDSFSVCAGVTFGTKAMIPNSMGREKNIEKWNEDVFHLVSIQQACTIARRSNQCRKWNMYSVVLSTVLIKRLPVECVMLVIFENRKMKITDYADRRIVERKEEIKNQLWTLTWIGKCHSLNGTSIVFCSRICFFAFFECIGNSGNHMLPPLLRNSKIFGNR